MNPAQPRLPEPADCHAAAMDFDVRCAHCLEQPSPPAGQCQLWAGHHSEHAVMFTHQGQRLVRTWHDDPTKPRDRSGDYESLPWLRGFPIPAWSD